MVHDAQEIPLERLEHEITSMAGQLAATTCRWLQLIAELDRREGWMSWGSRSAAHWLSWRCGLSERTARDHLRVAHALTHLPRITELFSRGELSYSKVRALTRIATPDNEEELVGFALAATAAQLDRTIAAYLASLRDPKAAHEQRVLYTDEVDGIGILRARLAAEDLAVVEAAIEAALKDLPVDDGSAEPSSIAQRRADALMLISESYLAHGAETRSDPERTMVVLHVDADGVTAPELEDGTPLHPATAERLGCDASVVAVIEKDGVPIGVGRKTRQPDTTTRGATVARVATAAGRGAPNPASCSCTTDGTGPRAGRPTSTTWCSSAGPTTMPSTRAASPWTPPTECSAPTASRSSPASRCLPRSWRSRSCPTRSSPAGPASASTSASPSTASTGCAETPRSGNPPPRASPHLPSVRRTTQRSPWAHREH